MRTIVLAGACVLALAVSSAKATIYNDTVGGNLWGAGVGDIVSVEVTDDGTNINFKFNVNGDPTIDDYAKYMVMIDSVNGGDNVSNGWNRPIGWGGPSGQGADYWLGSWADWGNGAETYKWNGSTWGGAQDATYSNGLVSFSKNNNSVTVSTGLSRLGLGAGQTFCFDAFTSGGGGTDGAIDSLGNPNQQIANWDQYSTATPVCYTTTPEPGSLALLGLGALAIIRRKR